MSVPTESIFNDATDLPTVLSSISNYAIEHRMTPLQVVRTFNAGLCARSALQAELSSLALACGDND
jgi:hypothetical protein